MTTAPIAPKTPADPAQAAPKARSTGEGGAFSSVLKLKLGMGLKTAMPAAQSPRSAHAKSADHPAEPAPARDARRPDHARTPGARDEPADRDATRAAEPNKPHGARRPADEPADRDESAAEAPIPASAPADHARPADEARPAQPATSDTQPTAEAEPKPGTEAQPNAQPTAQADAQATAAAPNSSAEAAAASPALAAAEHAAGAAKINPAGRKPAAPGARPAQAGAAAEPQAGDGRAEAPSVPDASSARAGETPRPEAPPPTQARDPLGLIRTPVESPDTAPAPTPAPTRGEPGGDHARFADAPNAAAPNQTQPTAGAVMPGALFTGPAASAVATTRPGGAPAGGVGAVGGAGGSGGAGGAGAGGGPGGDPAGLLAGRAFGAGVFALGRTRAASTGAAAAEPNKAVQAQISQALAAVLKQKGGVMSLRLNPEHLGSMKIDLEIEGGKVTALFDAQNEQTRQILRDGLDGLKRSIEQAGLTIHKIEVVNTPPAPTATTAQDQPSPGHQHAPGGRDASDGGSGGWNGPSRDRTPRDEPRDAGDLAADDGVAPAVWAEQDGTAQGLLRLRVDALI